MPEKKVRSKVCFICFEEPHLTFCIARLGEEEEESDDDEEEEEYVPSESESEQSEVEPKEKQEEEEEEDIIPPTVEEKKVIMPPKKKKDLEDGFKSLSLSLSLTRLFSWASYSRLHNALHRPKPP